MADELPDRLAPTVHANRRPVTVTDRLAKLGISINLRLTEGTPPPGGPAAREPRPRLDRYAVAGELGAGGMGAVLLVDDSDIGRQVAAKVMHARAQGDPQQLRRFLLEAKVAGQLEHPNIVPVYELGLSPAHELYFTMKRISGRDLAGRIGEVAEHVGDGSLDYLAGVHPLLDVFGKVCDAIAFAHDKGVVHRDLKPANVMVGRFGEVLVVDWGLAKVIGEGGEDLGATSITLAFPKIADPEKQGNDLPRTLAGDVIGTPNYMPPEQAAGRIAEIDARSDIYALGAILYHILTFHPPLHGLGTWTVIAAAGEGRIDPPSVVRADLPIPWELDAVVRKAMAKDPAQRYASALDLKRDVERYVAGGLINAASYSAVQLLRKWARRHGLILGAGAVVSAIALVMGGVSVTSIVRAHATERAARADAERALAETQLARGVADRARRTAEAARADAEAAAAAAQQARALELAAKDAAVEAHRATSRTLADALAYKAGLALDQRRLLDAALYVAAAHATDPGSVAAEAVTAGLARSPLVLDVAWDAHDAAISLVATSKDGRRYATGDELGRVRVWDTVRLTRTASYEERGYAVCSLDFSRDGRYLLAADYGGFIVLLDAATGKVVTELSEERDEVSGAREVDACCSPTADLACFTSGGAIVQLVRLPGGEPVATLEGRGHAFSSLAFSPDGARLVGLDAAHGVWLWDVATHARIPLPAEMTEELAGAQVSAVALAGTHELLTCGTSGLDAWDLERGVPIASVDERETQLLAARPCRLGAHRAAVATAADGTLRLYDLDGGRLVAAIGADRLAPYALAMVGETGFLAADRAGEARVWRISAGAIAGWSPGGLALRTLARGPDAPPCELAFAPNGRFAAVTSDRELAVVDLIARERMGSVALARPVASGELAVAEDGRAVAFVDEEGELFRWDTTANRPTSLSRIRGGDDGAFAVAMSADGRRLWSGHASGDVVRWSAEEGQTRLLHVCRTGGSEVMALGVHAPAEGLAWVVAATDTEVLRVDAASGAVVARRRIPRKGIDVLACAPDGLRFASGGADGELRLWGALTLEPEPVLGAHLDAIAALTWAPDGRLLVSAGDEGTVAFWDPAAARLLRRHEHVAEHPVAVWLAGGGRHTLVAHGNGDLEVLGADPPPDLRAAMRTGGLILVGADLRCLPAKELAALGR